MKVALSHILFSVVEKIEEGTVGGKFGENQFAGGLKTA